MTGPFDCTGLSLFSVAADLNLYEIKSKVRCHLFFKIPFELQVDLISGSKQPYALKRADIAMIPWQHECTNYKLCSIRSYVYLTGTFSLDLLIYCYIAFCSQKF